MAQFMAAIAYGKEVTAAEQYFGRINADTSSPFVDEHFPSIFKKYSSPRRKLFSKIGIHHKIVAKPDLLGIKQGHGSFLFQHVVLI